MTDLQNDQKDIIMKSLGYKDNTKLTELRRNGEGKYLFVNIISKRAKDIYDGSKPLVQDVDDPTGECYPYASEEVDKGLLSIKPKKEPSKLIDLINERQ